MKVLVVEPHGDDAFISCSSALMRSDLDITVMTMSDRHSHQLRDYYDSVNRTIWMDVPDVHYDLRLKYSTHDIHQRYLASEDLYKMYMQDMQDRILSSDKPTHSKEAMEAYAKFIATLNERVDLIDTEFDLAIIPVGLFHPNHYATRRASNFYLIPSLPRIYYVDKPYIEKRYVQEILKCSPYKLYTAPVQDKDTRAEIFKNLYPTEQGLLRYSHQTILEWKDIYAVSSAYQDNPVVANFLKKVSDMKEGDKFEFLSLLNSNV